MQVRYGPILAFVPTTLTTLGTLPTQGAFTKKQSRLPKNGVAVVTRLLERPPSSSQALGTLA